MATYGGSNIVLNGLILNLDAGNVKSYPGSATTWFDRSIVGNNATLINGPTFSNTNGGAIVFDGVNDYITVNYNSSFEFCNSNNDLPFTISSWIYINNLTNAFQICNKGDNGDGAQESYAFTLDSSGSVYIILYDTSGANQSRKSTINPLNIQTWYNVVVTYSGTGGNTGANIYFNSILQNSTSSTTGTYTRMRPQSTTLFLGSFGSTGVYKSINSNGRFASYHFYNRALSASEVLQNYNALKSRFNL